MGKHNGHSDQLIHMNIARTEQAAAMAAEVARDTRLRVAAIAGQLAARYTQEDLSKQSCLDWCVATAINLVVTVDHAFEARGKAQQQPPSPPKSLVTES